MRILFLGELRSGQTSLMRMRALARGGYEVRGVDTSEAWRKAKWLARQVQRRLNRGAIVDFINESVIAAARSFQPHLVWAEKQEYLRASTIEQLGKAGARLVHFTPDPYFSTGWKRTALMDESIRRFDVLVYCKAYEERSYRALDRPLVFMPLGYCDEVHRPLAGDGPRWNSQVSFLGGWEPRRQAQLRRLAELGVDLKLWGYAWDFVVDGRWTPRRHLILRQLAGRDDFRIGRDQVLARAYQGSEVYADDYARAISGGSIGIGFLRSTWPDQHTTRTFEIPACESLLLADRTREHQEMFEEGREADFFSSPEELVDKVRFYLLHDDTRRRVASAGRERCVKSRYSYAERMAEAMKAILRA